MPKNANLITLNHYKIDYQQNKNKKKPPEGGFISIKYFKN